MYTNLKYNEMASETLENLTKGAFLTVKDQERLNTMIIGWGNIGVIWRKPIFTVLVRYSRWTYQLLEATKEFTVSIPVKDNLKKAVAFCGTYSGREYDKFKECSLTAEPAQLLQTPIVGECGLYYECKVVYQQAMEPALLNDEIRRSAYPEGDYHVLYYGEIVACYRKEIK
ncbi:MAG: flavin reductase family protein [Peptococcaceae bacterium]|nr:flavin reductase family protein [Peptococcaceae bacterium]